MKLFSQLRNIDGTLTTNAPDIETPYPPPVNAMNNHIQAEGGRDHTTEKKLIDVERQTFSQLQTSTPKKSVYQSLGWLDRLLALWILLAIITGILLGNYVDSVGPALQRGKFVQVSVPIGQ